MQGYATVKAVPSGDTVELFGDVANGAPNEMQLTLAFISAPRIARGTDQLDEPFGYESREFLRALVVGRRVRFKVEYKVEKIGRTFASIFLDDENLAKIVVGNGWASVKSERSDGDGSEDYEELVRLELTAQQSGRGMFTKTPRAAEASIRSVVWDHPDPMELYGLLAGTPQRATVEHVRDGASLRIYVPHYSTYLNLNLAGVRCPRVRPRTEDGTPGEPEEFALEARFFTEVRLLHRSVIVHVEGLGKTGGFFGTVEHPNGNVSAELLRLGLAQAVGWSARFTSRENQDALRMAQDEARAARRGLWVNAKAAPPVSSRSTVQGSVGEVVSGDSVIILDGPAGAPPGSRPTRRLYISSIRAPRQGNREHAGDPWSWQAKEELRRMLIGRRVDIIIDYSRKLDPLPGAPADAAPKTRVYGTVLIAEGAHKGKNAGVELVRRGLAEVVRHRMDEDRAACYDELIEAEHVATARKLGIHSKGGKNGTGGTFRVNDLTDNTARAKSFLPHLQRAGLKAVVHHCFSGHRFKLYVPSEKCMVMFSLAGIRCPNLAKPARNGRPAVIAEPFGSDAMVTAKERVLQREVEIEVETMDSHGNALGSLFIGRGTARTNFALSLLENGLATVVPYSADRSNHVDALYSAEMTAKRAQRRVWQNVEVEAEEAAAVEAGESETARVTVCNVDSGAHFTVHVDGDPAVGDMKRRMADFTLRHGKGTVIGAPLVQPRRGMVCAALIDGAWERARVVEAEKSSDRSTPVEVAGLDTGSRATVTAAHLRPLEGALARAHPAARACALAFVRVESPATELGLQAAEMFDRLTAGRRPLIAEIHGRDAENRLTVTLRDEETGRSIAQQMLKVGVARVSKSGIRSKQADETREELQSAQRVARQGRLGMFRFGEPDDTDTEA